MYKTIRGTKDILPEEALLWQEAESRARRIFAVYGYKEIRTPLLEEAELFNRSLGETTEIVQKQMFLIKRDSDTIALRPEGTASVVRAWLENHLDKQEHFSKLYYLGPMFRAERPQKGRLRQFHHIGCEAIGSLSAELDVEVISLLSRILGEIGVKDFELRINSLGCAEDKKRLSAALKKSLKERLKDLCEDCVERYQRNVLRILDCKKTECKEAVGKLDILDSYLCEECGSHFKSVLEGLSSSGIPYKMSNQLVRGLDYYTRTVFEATSDKLGSQDALAAGGRYDMLIKELGGDTEGAVGFALGVERAMLSMDGGFKIPNHQLQAYIIPLSRNARRACLNTLQALRNNNIISDMDYENRSLKANMRKANDIGARFALLVGDDEISNKSVAIKDMRSGTQESVAVDNLQRILKDKLGS